MAFDPHEHVIIMERKSKKKDAQGRETWEVSKTEYLPVQWRLFWFRLENPKGKIDSKAILLDMEKGAAVFETYVEREDCGNARMHGSETQGDWKDYIEKAQTKSLGRALAAVGYGSQFTDDEFTEGERIVDSPVEKQSPAKQEPQADDPYSWKNVQQFAVDSGIRSKGQWEALLKHCFPNDSAEEIKDSPAKRAILHGEIKRRAAKGAA